MKRVARAISLTLMLVLLVTSEYIINKADFDEGKIVIRVPQGASVYLNGELVGQEAIIGQGYKTGRIHEIAILTLNQLYAYSDYEVVPFSQPEQLKVIDIYGVELSPVAQIDNVIEFIGSSDKEFMTNMSDRIKKAAVAYHNRCGGYDKSKFDKYFLNGSDAYKKGIKSDEGRKYGQNVKASKINAVNISELYKYSDKAFTVKVDISASGSYDEAYTIYFLFQWNGSNYYVTNYTYR